MTETPRRCRHVRERLPAHVAGELGRVRATRVRRHVRRCDGCGAEERRQRAVAAQLADLGAQAAEPLVAAEPPAELLADLLAQVREPDLRARAAAPVRGAVSGARPGLSAAGALLLLALLGLVVWGVVRLVRGHAERSDG